ncbi:MAG: ribonuclease HII [Firmicutes bacterium]|nr:ribonuclease HII [Bacillota bacterium]
MRAIEESLWQQGYQYVIGVDEVGRGPLAGPVVAAAVFVPPDIELLGVRDSKSMTPRRRVAVFKEIIRSCSAAVGAATAAEIDRLNILNATLLAMERAVRALGVSPDFCLVDGRQIIPGLTIPQQAVVKGDAQCLSIAAASIVAKVVRDRFMIDCHQAFPQYGFDKHKGYPTAEHRRALEEYGPCPIHRQTFGKAG